MAAGVGGCAGGGRGRGAVMDVGETGSGKHLGSCPALEAAPEASWRRGLPRQSAHLPGCGRPLMLTRGFCSRRCHSAEVAERPLDLAQPARTSQALGPCSRKVRMLPTFRYSFRLGHD